MFDAYSPKLDTIKAQKLTKDSLHEVAAYILRKLGGKVEVGDDFIGLGDKVTSPVDGRPIVFEGGILAVDEWVVEEWLYEVNRLNFRSALLSERKKYDLR